MRGNLSVRSLSSDGPRVHGRISWEGVAGMIVSHEHSLYPQSCSQMPGSFPGPSQLLCPPWTDVTGFGVSLWP